MFHIIKHLDVQKLYKDDLFMELLDSAISEYSNRDGNERKVLSSPDQIDSDILEDMSIYFRRLSMDTFLEDYGDEIIDTVQRLVGTDQFGHEDSSPLSIYADTREDINKIFVKSIDKSDDSVLQYLITERVRELQGISSSMVDLIIHNQKEKFMSNEGLS